RPDVGTEPGRPGLDLFGRRGPAVGVPLTERDRLQNYLETAAAVTGRLVHDFGNVLTGILGFAELGAGQLPAESLARRHVTEVCPRATQGAEWLSRLRLSSRRRAPNFWPCSLPALLAEEEVRVRALWGDTVSLLVQLEPDLPPAALDADSLRQVLAELLAN